jgi:molecular chaperone DnaK (HSP70)
VVGHPLHRLLGRIYCDAVETSGHLLGIDFGTSNTVAVARWPDGRVRSLLFDGAPLLPSAVLLDERGALVAGREALRAAK